MCDETYGTVSVGNFHMVLIFVCFVCFIPYTKIKTAKISYTARKCEPYQLRMRAISHRRHTKLKNTKIYSKGVLVIIIHVQN